MNKSSIYNVLDKPEFLNQKSILEPAIRQLKAADNAGYKVEWLISNEVTMKQIEQYFKKNNIKITLKLLEE